MGDLHAGLDEHHVGAAGLVEAIHELDSGRRVRTHGAQVRGVNHDRVHGRGAWQAPAILPGMLTRDEILRRVEELAPWYQNIDLGDGIWTKDLDGSRDIESRHRHSRPAVAS